MKKTKKVVLEESSIMEWSLENDYVINMAIYDNIFEFVKSDKSSYSVMRIYSFDDKDMDGTDIVTDFTITKSELNGTIDKLLKSFERYEEYDKCSEILKLQKSLVRPNQYVHPKMNLRSKLSQSLPLNQLFYT